jgi:CRP-like cAMP-binding protein
MSEYLKQARLRAMIKPYEPETVLFEEGEESRDLYILVNGRLKVSKDRIKVGVIDQPGSYVGEMSALLGMPRTATVTTASQCELIRVGPEQTDKFFHGSPELTLKLAKLLAERLRDTTDRLLEAQQEKKMLKEQTTKLCGKVLDTFEDARDFKINEELRQRMFAQMRSWIKTLNDPNAAKKMIF